MSKYEVRSLKYRGQTPLPSPEALVLRTSYFVLQATSFILPLGPIAQRLEPPAHNRPVPGSNPGGPTIRLAKRRERTSNGALSDARGLRSRRAPSLASGALAHDRLSHRVLRCEGRRERGRQPI